MNRLLARLPLLLLPACNPMYGHLEVELASSPPVPVRVTGLDIEVPAGVAIAVDVAPISGNDYEYFKTDEVVLSADDRQILRVDPTADPRRFVLTGVAPGDTCVVVEVVGEREECIPAVVTAAP